MAQADSAETESGRRRCALARPSSALERHCIAGRDVGFAESGFRPTIASARIEVAARCSPPTTN